MEKSIRDLRDQARQIRKDVLTMIHLAGDGHPGPALSIVEMVTVLYFRLMRLDPDRPDWPNRDRFILSKGHACPTLYAALARRGFFSPDLLPGLRSLGSRLQGHPDMNKTPGIDMTTGSLGHGLSIGAGMAAARRLEGRDYFVYVVMGDGELNEGIVWEGVAAAAHQRLDHLVVLVDNNGYQSGGTLAEVSGLKAILPRFRIAGWHCQVIQGHDLSAILAAVGRSRRARGRPAVILAHTVKGKGVPFMENDNSWHKRVPTAAELEQALRAIEKAAP